MRRIASNIAWLLSEKIVRLGLTLLTTIVIARYLGPDQFGLLNYVIALVSIFLVISGFGLQGTIVNDIVKYPDKAASILVNAFFIRFSGAILVYLILMLAIWFLRPDEEIVRFYVALLGLTIFFKSSDLYKFWFEAKIQSKYAVWAENFIFIFISLCKLLLVYVQAPLLSFVLILVLESLLVLLLLKRVFQQVGLTNVHPRLVDWQLIKNLLYKSWPLLVSAGAWVIYSKIDQVMLAELAGDAEVGVYSVAVKLSEVTNFLPGIIVFSFIPAILPLIKKDIALYDKRLQQLFDFVSLLMVLLATFVLFGADWFILTFFGAQYADSAAILAIHIWSVVFIAFSLISARHLIGLDLQKVLMQRNLFGLGINIVLNWFLIPLYGGIGAAWASLIAIICVNYPFDLFHPRLRKMFFQKTRALLQFNLVSNIRELTSYLRTYKKS